LFPGSRSNEIKFSFATIVATAQLIKKSHQRAEFLVPVAPHVDAQLLREQLDDAGIEAQLVSDSIYDVAAACDAVLCVSGTVTLQITLVGTPMVIMYKAAPLTYAIGRHIISVEHFGLPNIVAGKRIVQEYVQDEANPQTLFSEINRIIVDEEYARQMKEELYVIQQKMGDPGCSGRVAQMAIELSCRSDQGKRV
jgi:lipid-A-disaccharide synthase